MMEEALNASITASGKPVLISASGSHRVIRGPWMSAVTNSWATASAKSAIVTWETIMKQVSAMLAFA